MNWHDPLVFAAIGVFVTIIYTALTGLIWYATWQSTKATRQVLEAAHRPYVGVAKVELTRDDMSGETLLAATITNGGSVPSRYIEVELELKRDGKNWANGSTRDGGKPGYVALLPGQSFVVRTPLSSERNPELEPSAEFATFVTVGYKGMHEKQYRTQSTYTYIADKGFVISSGHFE